MSGDMATLSVQARVGDKTAGFLGGRPKWNDVYDAYCEEDKNDDAFLQKYFGADYLNNSTYKGIEPGAARVSIALIKSGMRNVFINSGDIVIPDGMTKVLGVTTVEEKNKKLKIIGTAKKLNDFLWKSAGWSNKKEAGKNAEVELINPISRHTAYKEIKYHNLEQPRNGLCIILGRKKNHATLWVGETHNIIDGGNIDYIFENYNQELYKPIYNSYIYFGELKNIEPVFKLETHVVLLRYKIPGLDKKGKDFAEDMCFGNGEKTISPIYRDCIIDDYKKRYSESGFDQTRDALFSNKENVLMQQCDGVNLNVVVKKALYDKKDIPKWTNAIYWCFGGIKESTLFSIFRHTAKNIFALCDLEMRTVVDDMIKYFEKNEGGVYTNNILTKHIKNHESTIKYCKLVEEYIRKSLDNNNGTIKQLENKKVYFENDEDIKEQNEKFGFFAPEYPFKISLEGINNATQGYTISLNGIWAVEILVVSYIRFGNDYDLKYRITLYDHFGLDRNDLDRKDIDKKWFQGKFPMFSVWFILQHLKGYKPFITQIAFENEMHAKINTRKVT